MKKKKTVTKKSCYKSVRGPRVDFLDVVLFREGSGLIGMLGTRERGKCRVEGLSKLVRVTQGTG